MLIPWNYDRRAMCSDHGHSRLRQTWSCKEESSYISVHECHNQVAAVNSSSYIYYSSLATGSYNVPLVGGPAIRRWHTHTRAGVRGRVGLAPGFGYLVDFAIPLSDLIGQLVDRGIEYIIHFFPNLVIHVHVRARAHTLLCPHARAVYSLVESLSVAGTQCFSIV